MPPAAAAACRWSLRAAGTFLTALGPTSMSSPRPGHSSRPRPVLAATEPWLAPTSRRAQVRTRRPPAAGVGAAVRDRTANRRPTRRPGHRSLFQGRHHPLQVRDRPARAGRSSRCTGSRSRRYSSTSPNPRAMSRRNLRSAKNRRRGGGCSRTHSIYMNCPMHQHAPNATLAATSIHHATANTSHSALPSCCHASPYGSRYLNFTHLHPGGRTEHHDHPVPSGRVHRTLKYSGGKGGAVRPASATTSERVCQTSREAGDELAEQLLRPI